MICPECKKDVIFEIEPHFARCPKCKNVFSEGGLSTLFKGDKDEN